MFVSYTWCWQSVLLPGMLYRAVAAWLSDGAEADAVMSDTCCRDAHHVPTRPPYLPTTTLHLTLISWKKGTIFRSDRWALISLVYNDWCDWEVQSCGPISQAWGNPPLNLPINLPFNANTPNNQRIIKFCH